MRRFIALFLLMLVMILFLFSTAVLAEEESPPAISAESALLMDADSRQVLYSKNENVQLPMASTTKIMTALVVLEQLPLDHVVTISAEAAGIEGSSVYLTAGEKVTVEDLLYALLLQSANDAAAALAIEAAGSIEDFAVLMNEKATELSLTHSSFSNPHGLDDESHYTTAYDLAILTAEALKNETFSDIVATRKKSISLHDGASTCVLINHNRLLRQYEGCIGVKTGYTKVSGRCLVSAAQRDSLTLICVTLADPNDWHDHTALLDYGFSRYERMQFATAGEMTFTFPVAGGTAETVSAVNQTPLAVTLPRGDHQITHIVTAKQFYYAPIASGELLGTITYYDRGTIIASSAIIACETVEPRETPSLWQRILAFFRR